MSTGPHQIPELDSEPRSMLSERTSFAWPVVVVLVVFASSVGAMAYQVNAHGDAIKEHKTTLDAHSTAITEQRETLKYLTAGQDETKGDVKEIRKAVERMERGVTRNARGHGP